MREHARRMRDLDHKDRQNEVTNRGKYTDWIFWSVAGWMLAVFMVVVLSGINICGFSGFRLSNDVLMVLLGTTTVNVIGVWVIVAQYLFPKRQSGAGG